MSFFSSIARNQRHTQAGYDAHENYTLWSSQEPLMQVNSNWNIILNGKTVFCPEKVIAESVSEEKNRC